MVMHFYYFFSVQLSSVMRIAEGREEQPHWVVRREEVELTEEVLGRGGWGEVKVANFCGLRVAAKFLYKVILSDYNRRQFSREMTIAAKIRHPNLLLFIGATREGEAVILTELLPTTLRMELETRVHCSLDAVCTRGNCLLLAQGGRQKLCECLSLSRGSYEQQQIGVPNLGSNCHFFSESITL